MTPQISYPRLICQKSILFLGLLCCLNTAYGQSPYPHFESWPMVKLDGGLMVCSPYQTAFYDDFPGTQLDPAKWDTYENGDPLGGRFHCGAGASVFTDDNVKVNNQLELTVKRNTPAYVLQDPSGNPFNAHCYGSVPSITRNATAGMVMMDQSLVYNLGKYEIRCKFPNKDNVWSAFWMWHHDEIDIFDIGFRSKFNQNSFSGGYTASIQQAPCCPTFVDCSYCPTNSVDCTAAPNCDDCGDQYWSCEYMATGFHTVGCEWTPFKVSFYVDGVVTGVVYRYYYQDKTPVIVECGGQIPEGLFRENPAYIDIQGRGFRPEIWITPEEDFSQPCNFASCFDGCGPNDLPATLIVDYVKIEERVYERITLKPECYELCANSNEPICVKLESEYYNFIYDNQWNWSGPTPPAAFAWVIAGNNGTITEQDANHACFTYNGPDCSGGLPCKRQINLMTYVQTHTGNVYVLTKVLEQPKPEVIHTTLADGSEQVCIDRNNYCGDFTATLDGQPLNTSGEFECIHVEDKCYDLILNYSDCGKPVTVNEGSHCDPPAIPSVPPYGLDDICTSEGTECYDFGEGDCDFTLTAYSTDPKLFVEVNGSEICLTSIWYKRRTSRVYITPSNACGTGPTQVWSIDIDQPIPCTFIPATPETEDRSTGTVPENEHVTIKIFSQDGEVVAGMEDLPASGSANLKLFNSAQQLLMSKILDISTDQVFTIDALPAGIYFINLQAGEKIVTKKVFISGN